MYVSSLVIKHGLTVIPEIDGYLRQIKKLYKYFNGAILIKYLIAFVN